MAGTPKLKVYTPEGEYVAACKYGEDATAVAQGYGAGATVRLGHSRVVLTIPEEGISYDDGAEVISAAIA